MITRQSRGFSIGSAGCTALRWGAWALLTALSAASCTKTIDQTNPNLLATVRVSLGMGEVQANGASGSLTSIGAVPAFDRADLSDDGRYVVFSSIASNLVAGDSNSALDVFLRDNLLKTVTLVSVNNSGTGPGADASYAPTISGDGRYVCFLSRATDIISYPPIDTGAKADSFFDVFVRDMQLGRTILVSRTTGQLGTKANSNSINPRISKDGRFVVFETTATNLDAADGDAKADIYRRQLAPGPTQFETQLISRATNPIAGLGAKGTGGTFGSEFPSISADGNLIVYQSDCQNLVAATPTEGGPKGTTGFDIFRRDVLAGVTIRVSISTLGVSIDPNGVSTHPWISGDGTVVVWESLASNFFPGDDTGSDIFVRDFKVAPVTVELISRHTSGSHAGSNCDNPTISGDGRYIVWDSGSTNMVDGDSNGVRDVFIRDRALLTTVRVSVTTFGGQLNALSLLPRITPDGRYVVFYTEATNASDDDTNGASDYFMRGPPF